MEDSSIELPSPLKTLRHFKLPEKQLEKHITHPLDRLIVIVFCLARVVSNLQFWHLNLRSKDDHPRELTDRQLRTVPVGDRTVDSPFAGRHSRTLIHYSPLLTLSFPVCPALVNQDHRTDGLSLVRYT